LWLLVFRVSVCVLLAAGPVLAGAPARADSGAELADPAGDTVNDDTGAPLDVPQADILATSIRATPGEITLNVRVRRPTDPRSDPAWDGDTGVNWLLDTNGDGTADFEADYYTEGGRIAGGVYRATENEDEPILCQLKSATFDADSGYTVVIDPACIGAPQKLAYVAEFWYDTNPADDAAPAGDDMVPDTGMSPEMAFAAPAAAPSLASLAPVAPMAAARTSADVPLSVTAAAVPAAAPVASRPGPPRAPPLPTPAAVAPAAAPPPVPLPNTGPSLPLGTLAAAAIGLAGLCAIGARRRTLPW
jgi:hypothetical protein